MLINREGRFKARVVEQGVDETGPNKLVTFTARFQIEQEYRNDDWYDMRSEKAEITGYFYLEKRDGSINTVAIDQLKAALGWDGRDPFWLQDQDFGDRLVQLTIGLETYEHKTRPKVKWLSHEDALPTPGVTRASGAARNAIANRLGSKLRANAGGTPRPAPAPSTPRPGLPREVSGYQPRGDGPAVDTLQPPAGGSAVQPPNTTPALAGSTMDEAWAVFNAACPADLPQAERERQWFKILAEMFPGQAVARLTAAEWKRVAEEAPRLIVPF